MVLPLSWIQAAGEAASQAESGRFASPGIDRARALLEPLSGNAWVLAAAALVASVIVAKLADLILGQTLKALAGRTSTLFDDRLIELLHRPVIQTVVFFGVLVALAFLEPGAATTSFVTRLVWSVIALVWTVFVLRASNSLLRGVSEHDSVLHIIEPRTFPLFSNLAKVIILALSTWCLISIWGANMTGWLASAGVVGLAIGFAAQDTLSNLFAGVFVIADAPFRVGDYIVLDTGDRGRVVNIGLRSTRLMTRDDVEITIPNSVIGGGRITNQSSGKSPSMRIRLPVSVAYGSDIDALREILNEIARAEPLALDEPAPRVRFRAMADSGLNFELMLWVQDPSLKGLALDALNTAIYKRLTVEGIEIPYPKRDVYLHNA